MAGFGIYVHAPWCRTRCPYCSFNVYADRDATWDRWASGVARDWQEAAPAFLSVAPAAHSVYLGGGTPSLAPPEALAAVLAALPRAPDAEVTLEANPGTVNAAGLAGWRTLGVTRLSLGIQTFNPDYAHLLNRGHTVAQARALVAEAADAGFRSWSVDVIFALPGQSTDDLRRDLEAILALRPPHVSLYGLTFEPGTPFGRAAEAGRMRPPDEAAWRAQYDLTVATLEAGGWERYEVSNFAQPGHRAVHNEAVWRGGWYAGLGPGAHGFEPSGHRTVATAAPERWLAQPWASRERPTPSEAAIDHVLSTLRHTDGLDLRLLASRAAHTVNLRRLRPALAPPEHAAQPPLLHREGDHLRLTHAGFPVADGLVARVCDALVPA